jgi:hypothetical protein
MEKKFADFEFSIFIQRESEKKDLGGTGVTFYPNTGTEIKW